MTTTNPIDPEHRKAIAKAFTKFKGQSDRLKLRTVSEDSGRPFMMKFQGRVSAHVMAAVDRLGFQVIGISQSGDWTLVHVTEKR